ncbi:gamma-secretase-activating protein [Spea bombifrons]|uniref:gamma-secretase-activating protein n=1 Tax=Spea bombifrons TaxID=233779 RepID=UPI002349BBAD|nr:gamma-secretase-activating protein [Spea bombifrons]
MLLDFHATFNLHRDVMPWILAQGAPVSENTERSSRTLRIVNVEQDGSVLYTWKGTGGFTSIGSYDPHFVQNKLLYSFDQDLYIISCSVNCEKTLLALSYCRSPGENKFEPIWPVSRYLALLIEIQPINNVRVLKVVDSSMKVQFLYPTEEMCRFPESHLLVVSEERYIEQYHICVATEEEGKVVIKNSGQLPKDRITEDFVWAQWDASEQRLFYIVPKRSSCVLHCVQFYPEDHYKNVFEVPLEIILSDQVISFVNLGIDVLEERGRSKVKSPNLQVFTNNMGGLCLIYVQPSQVAHEVNYMVVFLHKGCSKTFKVQTAMEHSTPLKNASFINLDSYIVVYLPDQFLHLINTRHPDLMCYHLFLAGDDARIPGMCCDCPLQSVLKSCVLEYCTGILYSVRINQSQLVKLLSLTRLDADKLAILHCVLLNLNYQPHLETQLIEWICENLSTCQSFDPIQEFITASLYRKFSSEAVYLDKLLPYTSVPLWNEDIDGVSCTTDITDMPVVKVGILKGFWEKFHSELEYMKVAQLRFRYANYIHRRDWCKLINEVDTKEKRNGVYQRSVLENVKKVLLNMETWSSDQRTVPLYQEEEYQHKELMGLMVIKLKDHLSQYLHIGKSKIDKIVLDYVSRQLDIVCLILEVVWRKFNMESCVFNFSGRGSSTEYFAFHVMCRISEAASKMCMPLPPGFHTLQLVLGVRCLPLGNFLHCIDSGVLHLTENFVVKLLKELDDDGHNEKIKYSIIIRLPEAIIEKVHHLWDHAISNKVIGMKYVKQQLCNLKKKEFTRQPVLNRSPLYMNFLPLNYLIMMLSEVEETALNPFEDDNIDATFLEEIALKQTAIALRLQRR